MKIAEMLERKRELGYSNETLSKKSGVPVPTIQKVLSGKTRNPRQKTLEALEAALCPVEADKQEPGLPYQVRDGAIVKPVDRYDPSARAYVIREEAAAYGRKRTYTMEDINVLPEGIWAELIDGEMIFRPAPTRTHQRINGDLYMTVRSYLKEVGKDCEVYAAPYAVYLWGDDSECFLPDLTVFCDHEKSIVEGCLGAPDWVIEIASPSTFRRDYGKKLYKYREAGVRLYWIIDPARKMTLVHQFDEREETTGMYPFEEEIPCALDLGLRIRIADFL